MLNTSFDHAELAARSWEGLERVLVVIVIVRLVGWLGMGWDGMG